MRIRSIALCLGVSATPSFSLTAQAGYDVIVLQDVGGQGYSQANAISAFGWSVGYSNTASGSDAVLWSPTGKATVLQDAGGLGQSRANAINAFGWSVGNSGSDAVLWSPSGKATVLQNSAGQRYSRANAINTFGWSVGYTLTESSVDAVRWSPLGKPTVLQDVGGLGNSQATAINDLGWSVGYSFAASGQQLRRRRQRLRVERWIFRYRKPRRQRGAVVAVGESDGSSEAKWQL